MCLHKFVKLVTSSVPVRKFYIDQMFVSVRMQCHNHVDTQTVKRVERAMQYIYDIKFGTLQVRKNEVFYCANALVVVRISVPWREHWSPRGLRDLITTTVNLNRNLGYLSSQKKLKFFKDTYRRKHSFIFPMSEWERMFFAKRQL